MDSNHSPIWIRLLSITLLSCSLTLLLGCSGADDDGSADDDDSSVPEPFLAVLVSIDESFTIPDGTPVLLVSLFVEGGLDGEGLPATKPVTVLEDFKYASGWPVEVKIDAPDAGTFEVLVLLDASGDGDPCTPGDFAGNITMSTSQLKPGNLVLDHVIAEGDCGHQEEE